MAQADSPRAGTVPRVSMGVPEIDRMLDGGLMPHRPYLVVGPSGTGKTSLALQFLCEGVRRGERVLYVTVEDPPNEVRWNHRALRPELDKVDVFDAIPDVMRYEHTPFKDIAAVRQVVRFGAVPERIRQTPEFSSVEITGTALEQMLRSEVHKHGYSRIVIDSLTALQYFCMKGFDPTVGAQTFLRFLTDLRATSVLTVEAPLEDVETPERMLARGEVRLFRWELENATVRAIGVEKFRGSSHDVRLHPYRISSKGLDVRLEATISRDTRLIVGPALEIAVAPISVAAAAPPAAVVTTPAPAVVTDPLSEQIADLLAISVDVSALRPEVEAARAAAAGGRQEELAARLTRLSAMVLSLAPVGAPAVSESDEARVALQRVRARADRARGGVPPTVLPELPVVRQELEAILKILPTAGPTWVEALPSPRTEPPAAASAPEPVVAPARPQPPAIPALPATPALPTPAPAPATAPPRTWLAPPVPPPTASSGAGSPATVPSRPAPFSEPPPLPKVGRLAASAPGVPTAPTPGPSGSQHPAASPTAPPAEAKAPAPAKRRKRASAPRRASSTAAPRSAAPADGEAAPAAEPKPRKRVVRRRKAPTVVSEAPVGAPPEPTSSGPSSPSTVEPPPPSPPPQEPT